MPATLSQVILVNETDEEIGRAEKLEAHQKGLLHRAFSIFIFNDQSQLLLQQRASTKYHTPSLWTNTCCSHPSPDENLEQACQRRLQEELGFHTPLRHVGHFVYKAKLENGLIEHELDHVFLGNYSEAITPNPEEIQAIRWIEIPALREALKQDPQIYTPWLSQALDMIIAL